ncbi:MAG: L-2-hydroxyglutarate oxidase [Saprospiraceae bacterium]
MRQHDAIIIGAGIVGLSTAWNLLKMRPGMRVLVVEKEDGPARHQSGHNSGVIHSGIYYKPGSQKAENCFRGYQKLIEFCRENGVAFDLCGKIIVAATPDEVPRLDKIFANGQANGMVGIRKISGAEAREIEPHVRAESAIWVPQTGIIDFADVARKYLERIQNMGGEAVFGQKVKAIEQHGREKIVRTSGGGEFSGKVIVNCAGLYADKVALMTDPSVAVRMLPFRGEFYELKKEREHLVRNLIYPVPNPNFPFLGVHFTRMIHGGIEAGPNAVLAFRREGYSRWQLHPGELAETLAFVGFRKIARRFWREGWGEMKRSFSKALFVKALQHLIPEIRPEDMERGRSGVRAMACDPDGNLVDDFLILTRPEGIVNVCNAPSPAATASLAIGEAIAAKVMSFE